MILAVLLTCAFYIVVEFFLYTILLFMGLFGKYVVCEGALAVMFYGWDCEF